MVRVGREKRKPTKQTVIIMKFSIKNWYKYPNRASQSLNKGNLSVLNIPVYRLLFTSLPASPRKNKVNFTFSDFDETLPGFKVREGMEEYEIRFGISHLEVGEQMPWTGGNFEITPEISYFRSTPPGQTGRSELPKWGI